MNVYVSLIETDAPEIYDGPRLSVALSEEEALADLGEWLDDWADQHEDQAVAELVEAGSIREALEMYATYTGRMWKIEEQLLLLPEEAK